MQWMPPPPPSPIPFAPSGENGDGDSIAPVFSARHVERVRHVVVVEVRGQELPVLVVDEVLVERGADRVHGRAVHLPLDDLRVDPRAAVVDGGVVDDLDDARLPVDLDHAGVDLRRVGERQLPRLLLRVDHAEVRPVDEAVVQGRVEVGRQEGVVRVHDRAERHERQRRLGRAVLDPREAVRELDLLLGSHCSTAAASCDHLGAQQRRHAPLTAPRPVTANWLA